MQNVVFYRSPLGMMLLAADEIGLTGAWFEGQKYFAGTLTEGAREERSPVTDEAVRCGRYCAPFRTGKRSPTAGWPPGCGRKTAAAPYRLGRSAVPLPIIPFRLSCRATALRAPAAV